MAKENKIFCIMNAEIESQMRKRKGDCDPALDKKESELAEEAQAAREQKKL
eukprot:CAMPEP_0185595582 /NCGR_PEP_ID=MMETSP0434-20130131/78961_1 /TAXON_ID=626734 ORGANISM="Favella taraikaensis, Strain Fe Narragansett Bay" /NCGR_SAMPLE_ID=MMETSP0434 /ASSEMBLY_ACC=CAM_ASM_000379 /LENGTH=50 /DNA_ID=CAMNT_0028223699 /DNA_START=441 /DNA_END=593 /DNA_ORIENTATION=-